MNKDLKDILRDESNKGAFTTEELREVDMFYRMLSIKVDNPFQKKDEYPVLKDLEFKEELSPYYKSVEKMFDSNSIQPMLSSLSQKEEEIRTREKERHLKMACPVEISNLQLDPTDIQLNEEDFLSKPLDANLVSQTNAIAERSKKHMRQKQVLRQFKVKILGHEEPKKKIVTISFEDELL